MSKSLVDRYEQILAEDPASTVFVELAKALIDRGEHGRAIDVCKSGINHHTKSVVGRVLWGKALINTGKASEAMNQFDLAMKIDRENPHAYNLISEVLLHKGLYRSALPILRKAAALQPNDGRIQTWLEQTKSALAGGPRPVVDDSTSFDEKKAEEAASQPQKRPIDDEALPTVVMSAYTPNAPAVTGEIPTQNNPLGDPAAVVEGSATHVGVAPPAPAGRSSATQVMATAQAADPFDAMNQAKGDEDVVQGLTSTFDALQSGAGDAFAIPGAVAVDPALVPKPPSGVASSAAAALGGLPDEPSVVVPNADLYGAPPATAGLGMLDDVVSMVMPIPGEVRAARVAETATAQAAGPAPEQVKKGGLLDEIPDALEPLSSVEAPKVELNTVATEAIAREYEKELRHKLAKKQAEKTFLQRNGGKLVGVGFVLVALAGVGAFLATRQRYGGKDLPSTIAEARTALNADTRLELQRGLAALGNAQKMDAENSEVWALTAYANAVLFAEHGGDSAAKQRAVDALAHPGVRDAWPELGLVSDWLLAEGAQAAQARQAIVASQLDKTDVHAAAGRILLDEGKPDEALKRLTRAAELLALNVRAVVALGDYYLAERDWDSAYRFFSSDAAKASPLHPARMLGLAEARLELGKEQAESLAEIEKLTGNTGLPSTLATRREMVLARLLASQDRNAEGVKVLEAAAKEYGSKSYETDLGFGVAWRATGNMKAAQESFEAALKKNPKSDDAKEGLGRVLLARFRERELLTRLTDTDAKRIAMVRGIAQVRLSEWKKARAEFSKTQVSGKYPAEAVIYLALVDASEGEADKAQKLLEKLVESAKRNKPATQVALGKVYWQRGDLKKARSVLEDAAGDPFDSDGNALLGELLLSLGIPDAALDPLKRAVDRNSSHGPARHNLVRTLLALGQLADALRMAEAGAEDNAASADGQKDLALALLYNGKSKEAADIAAKMIKPDTTDSEAFRIKAQVLFARADGKSAFTSLERSNKLNPKDAETFCEIGFGFYRQGAAETAAKAYEAAAREDAKSVCAQVGPFHARPFGPKSAADKLEQLGKTAPTAHDRAFALATAARVQLSLGQLKEARENSDKAVELMPFYGVSHFAAGEVAKRQKDDARALDAYNKAVLYEPSWGAARLALADALAKSGDENLPKAIAEYETFLIVSQSESDVSRVKKTLSTLKKKK
jgi:cellulose synthase operon protein C